MCIIEFIDSPKNWSEPVLNWFWKFSQVDRLRTDVGLRGLELGQKVWFQSVWSQFGPRSFLVLRTRPLSTSNIWHTKRLIYPSGSTLSQRGSNHASSSPHTSSSPLSPSPNNRGPSSCNYSQSKDCIAISPSNCWAIPRAQDASASWAPVVVVAVGLGATVVVVVWVVSVVVLVG